MSDKYRFHDITDHWPQFYSFIPDEYSDLPNELHYAIFGPNGPVEELRVYPNGDYDRFHQTMWDVWQEDNAVGLEYVTWEESGWSEYYFRPEDRRNIRQSDTGMDQ